MVRVGKKRDLGKERKPSELAVAICVSRLYWGRLDEPRLLPAPFL